jgi:hypothetical protein
MLKRIVTLSTVALMATLSTTAYAQPGGSDEAALVGKGEGGTTVYDFEDDDVDGEVLSPEGANLSSRGRSKHASLITIRPHFIPEMIKMANDI